MYNNINITAICGKKQNGRFIVNNGVIIFSALILYLLFVTAAPIAAAFFKNSYSLSEINNNPYAKEITKNNSYNNIAITNVTINTATYINNGQMLARQIDNNNLQNYISDTKGSVLKLNSVNKLQNQTYSYDAYGKPITDATKSNSVLNVINSFQYNGERFDNNTALQYLRARFYNVDTKRFINQDSYDLLNKFGYVNGNPVMSTDPSGHVNLNETLKLVEANVAQNYRSCYGRQQITILAARQKSRWIINNDTLGHALSFLSLKDLIPQKESYRSGICTPAAVSKQFFHVARGIWGRNNGYATSPWQLPITQLINHISKLVNILLGNKFNFRYNPIRQDNQQLREYLMQQKNEMYSINTEEIGRITNITNAVDAIAAENFMSAPWAVLNKFCGIFSYCYKLRYRCVALISFCVTIILFNEICNEGSAI